MGSFCPTEVLDRAGSHAQSRTMPSLPACVRVCWLRRWSGTTPPVPAPARVPPLEVHSIPAFRVVAYRSRYAIPFGSAQGEQPVEGGRTGGVPFLAQIAGEPPERSGRGKKVACGITFLADAAADCIRRVRGGGAVRRVRMRTTTTRRRTDTREREYSERVGQVSLRSPSFCLDLHCSPSFARDSRARRKPTSSSLALHPPDLKRKKGCSRHSLYLRVDPNGAAIPKHTSHSVYIANNLQRPI